MVFALFLSGLLMYKDKYRIAQVASVIFIVPWVLPEVVGIMGMRWMFNANWGTLNIILRSLTLPPISFFTDYLGAMSTLIYAHIWRFAPFWTLILYSLRLTIPQELYEAAEIDGASFIERFRFITLPILRRTYAFFTVLSIIWVMGSFATPWLLTRGQPGGTTHVAATIGYIFSFTVGQMAKGLAATMTLFPLLLTLLIIVLKLRGSET